MDMLHYVVRYFRGMMILGVHVRRDVRVMGAVLLLNFRWFEP